MTMFVFSVMSKLINLKPNRRFYDDILCGVFYVVGEDDDGNLTSLPEKAMQYYTEYFAKPEIFNDGDVEKATFIRFYTE